MSIGLHRRLFALVATIEVPADFFASDVFEDELAAWMLNLTYIVNTVFVDDEHDIGIQIFYFDDRHLGEGNITLIEKGEDNLILPWLLSFSIILGYAGFLSESSQRGSRGFFLVKNSGSER